MGTALVGLVLAGIVALIIRSMIRDKKNGNTAAVTAGTMRSDVRNME